MAPVAENQQIDDLIDKLAQTKVLGHPGSKNAGKAIDWSDKLPDSTKRRFEKYGVDLSNGYPAVPKIEDIPKYVDEAFAIRNEEFPYAERAKNADPKKKALLGAAKEVKDLTKHIGTEIVGLQLSELTEKQLDELALLIAERVVVFFRDQDLSPKKQREIGEYYGQVEVHPQAQRVPGYDGITTIWYDYLRATRAFSRSKNSNNWHTDLVHEFQPAGITHLHLDAIPDVGGDTLWSSGYGAYDKLSPALQKFLDGKTAIYRSAHQYLDRDDPLSGPKFIEREHPLVRTHPATGWKSLFVNRAMTVRIVGLEPEESKVILNYIFDVFEKNHDIQVRFNWKTTKPGLGTSALWDNRVSQHAIITDYAGHEPRHGTRVTSLADVPHFDPESKSQREALGLPLN